MNSEATLEHVYAKCTQTCFWMCFFFPFVSIKLFVVSSNGFFSLHFFLLNKKKKNKKELQLNFLKGLHVWYEKSLMRLFFFVKTMLNVFVQFFFFFFSPKCSRLVQVSVKGLCDGFFCLWFNEFFSSRFVSSWVESL